MYAIRSYYALPGDTWFQGDVKTAFPSLVGLLSRLGVERDLRDLGDVRVERLVRRGDVVKVHSLRRGAAEAMEAIAHGNEDTSKVVGRTIDEWTGGPQADEVQVGLQGSPWHLNVLGVSRASP